MDAMDILNGCTKAGQRQGQCGGGGGGSPLKRMPHLFSRVLELPCDDETVVSVVEAADCFTFLVRLPDAAVVKVDDVKVEVLEIVPGATKVLVRGLDAHDDVPEVNYWRFRLPSTTVPEKAVATYEHDHLSVMIPKLVDISCNNNNNNNEDSDETEEARMQRELLEDLESFGSPRRVRSSSSCSPRSSTSPPPRKVLAEEDLEKLQQEVLEDLESFGSPRRSRNCTQSSGGNNNNNNPDFFRSVGFWVGGLSSVPVQ